MPIAAFITRHVPDRGMSGPLSLGDCYSVAFVAIGLFFVVDSAAPALSWVHYLFKEAITTPGSAWRESLEVYGVLDAGVPFVAGVVLVLNGGRWGPLVGLRQKEVQLPGVLPTDAGPAGSDGGRPPH